MPKAPKPGASPPKGPKVLGPFEKGRPESCDHWWERHLWELDKDYCPQCGATRPREPKSV